MTLSSRFYTQLQQDIVEANAQIRQLESIASPSADDLEQLTHWRNMLLTYEICLGIYDAVAQRLEATSKGEVLA